MPIYNDTYVMIFFGLLKKFTGRWVITDDPDKVRRCLLHSHNILYCLTLSVFRLSHFRMTCCVDKVGCVCVCVCVSVCACMHVCVYVCVCMRAYV